MKVTRIYNDEAGLSYFEDIEMPSLPKPVGRVSEGISVDTLRIRETPGSYDQDWHCAPRRVLVVLLSGEVEIDVSHGVTRKFGAGDILLAEDTEGEGHRTRTLSPEPRTSLFISLPESA